MGKLIFSGGPQGITVLRQGIHEVMTKINYELDQAEHWIDDSATYDMDNRASMFLEAARQHIHAAKAELNIFATVASDELNSRDDLVDELEAEVEDNRVKLQELEE